MRKNGTKRETGLEKDKFIVACQLKYSFKRNSGGVSDFGNLVPLTGSGLF